MDVEELLDELEDIIETSWHLPMSGGRAIISVKEIKRIIEDIRLKFPKEMVQAKNIVSERVKIIDDTKKEAENIMKISTEKIRSMAKQNEITKSAQKYATEIINQAKIKSKEIKQATNQYVTEIMSELEDTLASNLTEIRKSRKSLNESLNNIINSDINNK